MGVTYLLDVTIDGELTGGDTTDHDETGANTGERATETELTSNLHKTGDSALSGETLGLVDLGKHGIGGLGDDGSSESSNETGAKVNGGLHAAGGLALVDGAVDHLGNLLEDDELGHGVRNPIQYQH